jgi:hypothetical protein
MRSHQERTTLSGGPERTLGRLAVDERTSRGGRSLALMVTVVAILMMVAL